MAIELLFSFAMGVSCLVFSLNLVRKLREDDHHQPPFRSTDGRGSMFQANAQGQGGNRALSEAAAGASVNKNEEDLRTSGSGRSSAATDIDAQYDRGIGSLLTRSAGSRLDAYYADSDDEYMETIALTAANGTPAAGAAGVVL